jgi:DNA repair protein RecN (Recombination protein N)
MLSTLRIKNLALVSDLTLELQSGLNIITGETGAGKSILIGALNLVLGERADRSLLRSGTDSCSVEALFQIKNLSSEIPLPQFLEENGLEPCEEGQLFLKRSFSASGANRQFINGSPTTLLNLKKVGDWLVDIHGPHDHQSLLHTTNQLHILDAFGNLHKLRNTFAARLQDHHALEKEKADLVVDDQTYAQQLDLLGFQVHEIQSARLDPSEEEALQEEYQRASNSSRLLELAHGAMSQINGEEHSVLDLAGNAGRLLQELNQLDPAAGEMIESHQQAVDTLQDLSRSLSHYLDKVEVDPARLQELEERLDLVQSLKRKYGNSLDKVIRFGGAAFDKLQQLEQRDGELERLNQAMDLQRKELLKTGKELSRQRSKLLPKLAKAVTRQLTDLGFQQSRFDIQIHTTTDKASEVSSLNSTGLDSVEFLFAPNPGEPPKALRAIASSGELARVMLAVKTVLAAEDQVPVLVFDEVDANVGGETAQVVGDKMKQIARQRQVFCVTHLAPVAAQAQAHFKASKQVLNGRTISQIHSISPKERVTELARMLGGQQRAARELAQSLLAES